MAEEEDYYYSVTASREEENTCCSHQEKGCVQMAFKWVKSFVYPKGKKKFLSPLRFFGKTAAALFSPVVPSALYI